jgi:hypothetical protein
MFGNLPNWTRNLLYILYYILLAIAFGLLIPNCTRHRMITYTKNAQVVTSLQTSGYKSVHKLLTSCVRTACSQLL